MGNYFLSIGGYTNGITYTCDANGNLLFDGTNTYSYAHPSTSFASSGQGSGQANGLGDRLQQTVNYTTTTYAVDIAGGLTNSYLSP